MRSMERAQCPACSKVHRVMVTRDWTDGVIRCCGMYGVLHYSATGTIRLDGYPFHRLAREGWATR